MAQTSRGIKYPIDYSQVADVPSDMQEMAESIDEAIGDSEESINQSITTIENDLTDLQEQCDESDAQYTTEISNLKLENQRLREDIKGLPSDEAEGESVDIGDSSEMRFKNFEISGNSKQETRSGKNLFDDTAYRGVKIEEGFRNENVNIELVAGTYNSIIFFEDGTTVNYGDWNMPISLLNANYSQIVALRPQYETEITAGQANQIKYAKVIYNSTGISTYYNKIIKGIMIVKNGEDISEYEQYGVMPSLDYPSEVQSCGDNGSINEVICNKNLFDKNTTTDGKYIDGNGSIQTQSNIMYSDYIQIKTNINYYITGRSEWASVALYDKNKTFLERISTTQPNGVLNITNSNCKYIIINALLTNKNTLQLEEGSTATSYEEHREQSYIMPTQQSFRAIDNIRDTFINKNNKWYERHPIFRKIFTGNETFNLQSINDYGIANFEYKTGNTGYQVNGNILCNRFITQTAGISSIKTDGIYMNWGDVIFIRILASEIDTVEKLKTWLATLYTNGTPVYVDYVLEEPLDIECTEEQSTILDQIENEAKTYKGGTHIYSTDPVSPHVKVEYMKDIETMFNNISNAVVALGGVIL